MTVFADSSALVKLYADEVGSEIIQGYATFLVSELARVEVPAALWRKHRMGALSAEAASTLVSRFEAELFGSPTTAPRLARIVVSPKILDDAARACGAHGLRAYDSVQLATALAVRDADPSCTDFAVFDAQLRDVAAIEGFHLVPSVAQGPPPRQIGS